MECTRTWPGHRRTWRRAAAMLALLLAAAPGPAQRRPAPTVYDDPIVYDDIAERLPSADEQRALTARVLGQDDGQHYMPRPAIWRIGDDDTTIYLFGTIHVLPPGFLWRNAGIDRIAARADTLLVESIDDGAGVASLTAASAPQGGGTTPILARVSPDHRRKLAAFLATLPPEAREVMDGLPTWIAAVAIGFVHDYRAGNVPGPGADVWLEAQFRARGRRIESIEDGAQVLASVNAVPAAEQRRMLDAALDARQPGQAEVRAPLHAWAKGEIGAGSALGIDLARSVGSSALNGPLLIDRNRAWAAALQRRLKGHGTMLFAAGAGHFIGPGSVLEVLRARGVTVTRVQ